MRSDVESEAILCSQLINEGKIILYPTDTIWGIGCDATNAHAVKKIFTLKQREDSKSMIILLADISQLTSFVEQPDAKILNFLSTIGQPTTVIYAGGKNVAKALLNNDGTIAIRVTRDTFCKALINNSGKPIVSTSANVSGYPSPTNFNEINAVIKNGVDYIVQHRQGDFKFSKPSAIIKMNDEGEMITIRS
jgi:L-threonylcarbamoyladenylate synthase